MPNIKREFSYSLSFEEKIQSVSLAKSMQPFLDNEIKEAKSRFPHFFTSIEDKSQMISIDISQIIFELLNLLYLPFNKPLSIQFTIIKHGSDAFVDYSDQDKMRLVINLVFLEKISKMMENGHGFEANARLRYLLAHEFFHLYSIFKYPAAMLRSTEATKNYRANKVAYNLDLGERSANLFAIKYLLNYLVDDENQKDANKKCAKQKKYELQNRIIVARVKKKLRSFFSK